MANKIINDLTAVASVADVDEFEVQISGEVVTKKCTRKQLTQIEETARIAQDDVIEFAVGLAADGTYPTSVFSNTWYLRTADHAAIVDRSGLVEDLSSDIVDALRILDYRLHSINQLLVAEVTLTSAEIKDLHNNAKVLVAHEDGYVIDVLSVTGFLDYTAPIYANTASDALKFSHMGGSSLFEIAVGFTVSAADVIWRGLATVNAPLVISSDFVVSCDSAITTGNSTMKFNVVYRKLLV